MWDAFFEVAEQMITMGFIVVGSIIIGVMVLLILLGTYRIARKIYPGEQQGPIVIREKQPDYGD